MTTNNTQTAKSGGMRVLIIAVLVVGAFFGAYRFAAARSGAANAQSAVAGFAQGSGAAGQGAAAGGGGNCCGGGAPPANGVTGPKTEAAAKVAGGVQKISVDLSQGYYNPNQIVLKAGVPAEITFGQGSTCAAQIVSQDLNFNVDTSSGPQTVKLPALKAGEYAFSCSMQMVYGKIVVK